MRSIFGLGGTNLKGEVKKTDDYIKELFKELIEPKIILLHPIHIEKAKNLINEILNNIKHHENLLESHHYDLHSFSEIYQLKNSIENILRIFEEVNKQRNNPHQNQKINYDSFAKEIKIELLKIRENWDIHKHKLHKLGILKKI